MEKRMIRANKNEPAENIVKKAKKDPDYDILYKFLAGKNVYIVASFNDWLPMQMKTIRTLNLERFGPTEDEDIPDHLYFSDDK